MAINFDQFVAILRGADIRYLIVPDQPAVALGSTTSTGRHFLVHAVIEAEGSLMQFRTTGYEHCPLDSTSFQATVLLLNELNFQLRMVKFTLDPADGEIVVFADLALLDSQPTPTQILGIIGFIMERLRECAERIETTVRTGVDPGESPDEDIIGDEEPAPEPEPPEPDPDDIIS